MTALSGDARERLAEVAWGVIVASQREGVVNPSVIAHAIAGNLMPVVAEHVAAELDLVAVLTVPAEDTAEDVREALFRRADYLRAAVLAPPTTERTTP